MIDLHHEALHSHSNFCYFLVVIFVLQLELLLVGRVVGSKGFRWVSEISKVSFLLSACSVSESAFGEESHFLIPLAILVMNWLILWPCLSLEPL